MWTCWERGAEDGEERAAKVRNNTTHIAADIAASLGRWTNTLKPNISTSYDCWWRNAHRKWENTLQRVGQNFYSVCTESVLRPWITWWSNEEGRSHCRWWDFTSAWTEVFPSLIWGTTEVSISRQTNLWSVVFNFTIQLSTQSGPLMRFSDVFFRFIGFWL